MEDVASRTKAFQARVRCVRIALLGVLSVAIGVGYLFASGGGIVTSYLAQVSGGSTPTPAPVHRCSNNARLQRVADGCHSQKDSLPGPDSHYDYYRHILVDDEHGILYCVIPRVASVSFKAMLILSSEEEQTDGGRLMEHFGELIETRSFLDRFGLRYLDSYGNTRAILYRLEHYFKFMVVRHPLERLYSEYEHKVKKTNYFNSHFSYEAKKKFQYQGIHPMKLDFSQFLRAVVDPHMADVHWETYSNLCHPCAIEYDQIIKLETVDMDILPLAKMLSANSPDLLPRLNVRRDESENSHSAYRGISPKIMDRVYQLYAADFDMFGYSWSNTTGLSCSSVNANGHVCC